MAKDLKPKKVKARIKLLKALPYKGIMVYLRLIDKDIFEYIIPYKGEVYSSYLIITEAKTKSDIAQAAALILASATATVDLFLGHTKLDKKSKRLVTAFEKSKKQIEKLPN